MGAITCAPEQNFTYTGYIKMRRMNALKPDEPEYILLRARDERIAPVMLEVRDEMKGYIADLLGNSLGTGLETVHRRNQGGGGRWARTT